MSDAINTAYDNETGHNLRVEMLGDFTIMENGRDITARAKKSLKIWKIAQYLIVHRNRAVPQNELVDIFFGDENKANPSGSLRTMIHRLRAMLAEHGLTCADTVISVRGGCYSWDSSIACETDTEQFERYIDKAAEPGIAQNEKSTLLLAALDLYKGDFLPSSSEEMWVLPLVRYYRNMYLGAVRDAFDILFETGRMAEAEGICTKALAVDPFDEQLIGYNLRALLAQGRNHEALEIYKKMEATFYDELGIDFSDELRALYGEILRSDAEETVSLNDLAVKWQEEVRESSAYYCDLSFFKMLYQIETLSASRTGNCAYLVRFDTKREPDANKRLKDDCVMRHLEQAILNNLRSSDVFTRCSPDQHIIMLRNLTYEDCKMLINRILGSVDSKYLPKIANTSISVVIPRGNDVLPMSTAKFQSL